MEATMTLEDVTKVFGHGDVSVRAVDGVSLTVQAGEVVLVMGPSGSGKTTLLALAGCLLRPTTGRVWFREREVTTLGEGGQAALRRTQIGFIFQHFNLLSALTARENVELVLGLTGRDRSDARRTASGVLGELGLGKRLDFLPGVLSGGEQQRVAVARALASDPAVILADEPTANLDSRSGRQVAGLLADAAHRLGKAVVIVSHDHRLTTIADRIVWMEDGRIVPEPPLDGRIVSEPLLT
ncbi:MAG: ABC transporter ATP-binding protein [Firmicutes bacterium]|nr:ABC transporter ATP-binding protein [Bacillota bacterium]